MIQLLIVDDHPLIAGGIELMLKGEAHISITASVKSGKEALQFLEANMPDVALVDISLPDINGLELCEAIRKNNKDIIIIALTSSNDAAIITQFLSRGGNGYLLKNMEREELLQAIEKTMQGKVYLSKEANEKVLQQFTTVNAGMQNAPILTRREKEILQQLNLGLNGPQIADKLFLSPYTVETHRKNLMQKFNANNLQTLLKAARESNYI